MPTFTITNIFTLSNLLSTYGADCSGDVACNDQRLFDDLKSTAQASVDFTAYDHVMLYHAGSGQETSGVASDIWSVYFPTAQTLDGKSFQGFTVVPEREAGLFDPLGVIAHEYGHQIGLPDLYDVSVAGGRSTVGTWDLMDYPYAGTTAADGSNPPHLGAWSKKFLGFANPGTQGGAVGLSPAETLRSSAKIDITAGGAREYFLTEYRLRTSAATYDKGIPMSGLAVWHVDDDVALDASVLSQNTVNTPSQNGKGHRGVDLVEADGIESNPQSGDLGSGDAFVDGQTFSSPMSNTFSGQNSGVTITKISGVGATSLSMTVTFIQASVVLSVLKAISYPNPGGDLKKYPVRAGAPAGTITTLALQLSRPVEGSKFGLNIFDMGGRLIRSVPGTDIQLKLGAGEPSGDFKWVYEYDWNGRNDDGEDVVSGVYFYRFKAQEEVEKGKLIIIR